MADRTILVLTLDVTNELATIENVLTAVKQRGGTVALMTVSGEAPTPAITAAEALADLSPPRETLIAAVDQSRDYWLAYEAFVSFAQEASGQPKTQVEEGPFARMYVRLVRSGLVTILDPMPQRRKGKTHARDLMVRMADCHSLVNDPRFPGMVTNLGAKGGALLKTWIAHEQEAQLNCAVWDLPLEPFVSNTLARNDIRSVGTLVQKSEQELAGLHQMGDMSLAKVKAFLAGRGLELAPNPS